VNLHWGFVAGLGLCGAYVLLEAGEFPFAERRKVAQARLRKAWPWLLATGIATFINPWGTRLYREVVGWGASLASAQSAAVTEFAPLRITWSTVEGALDWRDPGRSAIWWMLAVALIAIVVSIVRTRLAAAILLAASILPAVQRVRFQSMFACVVVVVGGGILNEGLESLRSREREKWTWTRGRPAMAVIVGLCVCFVCVAGVRAYDLMSNRYYLRQPTAMLFGSGLSWWYPERALAFIERERLPGNILSPYNLGGYLTWRLPQYPNYIDGRGRPFAGEQLPSSLELPAGPADSPAWQPETDKWGINTMVVSLARVDGMAYFPRLREYCESQMWRPVYLDEVSAVFLRRTPQTQPLIDRLQVDCEAVGFAPAVAAGASAPSSAELFNYWSNSALVLDKLGRKTEALEALNRAQDIFSDSGPLHFQRGLVMGSVGNLPVAEQELRRAIDLLPDESPWFILSKLYLLQQRYTEAEAALRNAAEIAQQPMQIQQIYLGLGRLQLQLGKPREALAAFDKLEQFETAQAGSSELAAEFHAAVAEARARAWQALGDPQRALSFQRQAVRFTPKNENRQKILADLYQSQGGNSEKLRAKP
jgi:hypothetical protein